ncbi:MAG: NUDIX hydrolase [Anaerolineales bacterium]|nr:NUDIX hydrolase [Anaerolineales bacterium]
MNAKTLAKRNIFSGKVFTVTEHDINFGEKAPYTFEVISFNVYTGVNAIPLIDNKIILINYFQPAIGTNTWRLPGGGVEWGKNPEEQISIELQEEIGFKPNKITLIAKCHMETSYVCNAPAHIYLAENLEPSRLKGDEPFGIRLASFKIDKLLEMIYDGEITDTRTAFAILFYHQFLNKTSQ